jgi:lipopolysaccharide transport system ATP-binding protein
MGEIASSGRTIFFVSHNLASVGALCTRALLMDGGRLAQDGEVDAVLDHYLSTVQVKAGESLEDRDDRQGDGRLLISHVEVRDRDGGPPRTGADATMHFRYAAEAPDREATISIAVDGPLGDPVFFLSNRLTGEPLRIGSVGEIVCSLPSLPLLPGRYSLTFYVEVNGVLADWVRNAMYFDVFEADIFGTGQLPPTTHGRVAVTHAWRVGAE